MVVQMAGWLPRDWLTSDKDSEAKSAFLTEEHQVEASNPKGLAAEQTLYRYLAVFPLSANSTPCLTHLVKCLAR